LYPLKSSYDRFLPNAQDFVVGVADESETEEITKLVLKSFKERTKLSSDLSFIEKRILQPLANLWDAYTDSFAYNEILTGLKAQLPDDMDADNLVLTNSMKACILVVKDRNTNNIIASVALRLLPPDGKIPFSQPFYDIIERELAHKVYPEKFADPATLTYEPYLCNLCVDESYRGQKLGNSLVQIVEQIAFNQWGKSKLYLHVDDVNNIPAFTLYKKRDFQKVQGIKFDPAWAGDAANIGFFVKKQ